MLSKTILTSACLAALAAAAPAPQVSGYTNADAPYASEIPSPIGPLATFFGDNSQVPDFLDQRATVLILEPRQQQELFKLRLLLLLPSLLFLQTQPRHITTPTGSC